MIWTDRTNQEKEQAPENRKKGLTLGLGREAMGLVKAAMGTDGAKRRRFLEGGIKAALGRGWVRESG